jgi:hypothetical protein
MWTSARDKESSYHAKDRAINGMGELLQAKQVLRERRGKPHCGHNRPVNFLTERMQSLHQNSPASPHPAQRGGNRSARPASSQR